MEDILFCHNCKPHSEPTTVVHFDSVWSEDASADFSKTREDLIFDGLLIIYLTDDRILFDAGVFMKPIPEPELRLPVFVSIYY